MQRIIREEFVGATLLTVAHRLHTVADFDHIAVMENGQLVEFGPPLELLNRQHGAFASMVEALGPDAAAAVREKASTSPR